MTETNNKKSIEGLRQEMETALKSGDPHKFFNNFILKFPYPEGYLNQRYMAQISNLLHKKHGDIYRDGTGNMSKIFLNQTPAEFYEQIDTITLEAGYSRLDIQQLVSSSSNRDRFYSEIASPVFIKLLELGYNQEDLKI